MRKQIPHIIFLHLPKAGGMTFRSLLRKQYPGSRIFEIGADVAQQIKQFKDMDAQQREQIKLFMGHMSHGLHRYFSESSTYITMLRDPVERVFSEYRFLSSNRDHELFKVLHGLSFKEYLEVDPTRQGSNGQTRLLSGIAYNGEIGIPDVRPLEETDFKRAMENLKKYYPSVGLLDKYDESLMLWRKELGWRFPFYLKKNITTKTMSQLSKSDVGMVNIKNQFDLALYQQAEKMLNEKLESQSYLFRKQLSLFRILNHYYQQLAVYRRRNN
jgi:hypothetical protein